MKHLRSYDDRFLSQYTFANKRTLDARNTFLRHLDTQVTTRYHNAIGHFKYLVNIIYSLLIFDFGYNFNITVMRIKYFTDIEHILPVTDKRMGDKINILFNGIQYIVTVFFRQRRQVDTHTRHIHTFTATQSCFILNFTYQIVVRFIDHPKFQITVIDKNGSTYIEIAHKIGV